jgi:RNA 2',3'-cyclic 3'-phosphodiesterase
MARPPPSGQMPLFDELPRVKRPDLEPVIVSRVEQEAPLPNAFSIELFPVEETALAEPAVAPPMAPSMPPRGPDPVFWAVLTGGKVTGEIVAAGLAQKAQYHLSAPLRPAENLHISVLGAGIADDLTDDDIDLLVEAGDAVSMPRFEVSFTEAMSFRRRAGRNPLVLPCDEGADAMASLAEALWAQMRERGFTLKSKLTAVYHLTLAYDPVLVPRTPLEQPIHLPVREFALVRSRRGEGKYETIEKWSLAG